MIRLSCDRGVGDLLRDGRDPDGIEAHALCATGENEVAHAVGQQEIARQRSSEHEAKKKNKDARI